MKPANRCPRVILLADMNAFFASVEQVDHPERRGRPVALEPRAACQPDLYHRKNPRRERAHAAMDTINARLGALTLALARLLGRSTMPGVISPAWKPEGHRKTV